MPRRAYLKLWRTKPALELHRDFALLDDIVAFLGGRLIPKNDDERHLIAAFLRGGDGRAEAALALAGRHAPHFGMVPDLAMTLVLVAALGDLELAFLTLAQALDARAYALEIRIARLGQGSGTSIIKREVALYRRLAGSWSERTGASLLSDPRRWSNALARIAALPLPEGGVQPPVPNAGTETGPTRVVVAAIGNVATEAGGNMDEAYGGLSKPLPLKGGDVDPEAVHAALLAEFPHVHDAIDRIVSDLRLRRRAGVKWLRFRPLLLVGPPGVGKTRFAKRIAQLMQVGYGEVSGAGSSDDRALRGTARGWRDAQPALPLLVMMRTGCANPIIFVNQIEKAGGSQRNGDIRQTLLAMLESESARTWFDEALLAPADLSAVSWILAANDVTPLSAPLLSRVAVVRVPPPGPEMFNVLLANLLGVIAEELGVPIDALPPLAPAARVRLRQAFIEQPDLRRIKRAVEGALSVKPSVPTKKGSRQAPSS